MPIFDFYTGKKTKESHTMTTGTSGEPGVQTAAQSADQAQYKKVSAIIEQLRPFMQSDGGDCVLIKVEDGIAYVQLTGACHGCPSALATLKSGIEARVREAIPEIQAVEMI